MIRVHVLQEPCSSLPLVLLRKPRLQPPVFAAHNLSGCQRNIRVCNVMGLLTQAFPVADVHNPPKQLVTKSGLG